MMLKEISEEDVRKILADVKHPAIDRTLLDLGIIKSIIVKNDNVEITLAFPFPNIPIGEQIINSVRESLDKQGLEVKMKITVMNEEELQKFLSMEQESWRGDI